MPSLGLSPKTMPSTCRRKALESDAPDVPTGIAAFSMYAFTWVTRSAGAGCVDSQFGTPRLLPLASSSRDRVVNIPATPAGFHPVFAV